MVRSLRGFYEAVKMFVLLSSFDSLLKFLTRNCIYKIIYRQVFKQNISYFRTID